MHDLGHLTAFCGHVVFLITHRFLREQINYVIFILLFTM
jgi:hypothetical protein